MLSKQKKGDRGPRMEQIELKRQEEQAEMERLRQIRQQEQNELQIKAEVERRVQNEVSHQRSFCTEPGFLSTMVHSLWYWKHPFADTKISFDPFMVNQRSNEWIKIDFFTHETSQ